MVSWVVTRGEVAGSQISGCGLRRVRGRSLAVLSSDNHWLLSSSLLCILPTGLMPNHATILRDYASSVQSYLIRVVCDPRWVLIY